eukprot:1923432-Prymnesium_polylepis.1
MDLCRLDELRCDAFAEDVPLPDLSVAGAWTEQQAAAYFDSGGDVAAALAALAAAPAAVQAVTPEEVAALGALLTELGLGHLASPLADEGRASLRAVWRS